MSKILSKNCKLYASHNALLKSLIRITKTLKGKQLSCFIDKLYQQVVFSSYSAVGIDLSVDLNYSLSCKKCGSVHIVKNGNDRHGHTRFICKDCGSTFGEVIEDKVFASHKDASVWKEFIMFLLSGYTLEECAKKCKISKTLAFTWKHVFLETMSNCEGETLAAVNTNAHPYRERI